MTKILKPWQHDFYGSIKDKHCKFPVYHFIPLYKNSDIFGAFETLGSPQQFKIKLVSRFELLQNYQRVSEVAQLKEAVISFYHLLSLNSTIAMTKNIHKTLNIKWFLGNSIIFSMGETLQQHVYHVLSPFWPVHPFLDFKILISMWKSSNFAFWGQKPL